MSGVIKVATTEELTDQQAKLVEVGGNKIALFYVNWACYALSDACTHRGGPLGGRGGGGRGDLPLARGEIRPEDRGRLGAAARTGVKSYPVKVTGRAIEIEL